MRRNASIGFLSCGGRGFDILLRMIRVYIEVSALELRGVHHHLFKQFSYRDNPLSLLQFLAKNAATGRSIRSGAVTN